MPGTRLGPYCSQCGAHFRRSLRFCPTDGGALVELPDDPMLGKMLGGRYLVQSIIGDGGMGRVYFATDGDGEGRFAIKILHGELAAEPRHYERFVREAVRTIGLDHPNLVRVLDFGATSGKQPYVVMEHVPGTVLSHIIRDEGPLPAERIVPLLVDLCRVLSYVHARAIIHRDIKCGNVLVTRTGDRETARLFDFGVALDATGAEERLTTERTAIGTLSYMSPERTLCQPFDQRSDLFSLGVVLYRMLAGERPFRGTPMLVAIQNLTLRPPPIAERVSGLAVDHRLEAMAIRLMQRDPAMRYQSADELLRDLQAP